MKNILSKRERVERTLNFLPVDRVAIHDQVGCNPGVISLYTGKKIEGFQYTLEDVCEVIKKTLDMCFPPKQPKGTSRYVDEDGFVYQEDNWTTWVMAPSSLDVKALRKIYIKKPALMKIRDTKPAKIGLKQKEGLKTIDNTEFLNQL